MLEKLRFFATCLKRLGVADGLSVYTRLLFKKTDKIKFGKVKYPFKLRPNTSDPNVFDQIFIQLHYNIDFEMKPQVIIDGGANIGLFSIYMKNLYPDAKIVAIEPDPENFKALTDNLKPYENMSFENAGLWYNDAYLKIHDKYNGGKWALVVEEDPTATSGIKGITINSIIEKYNLTRIDVLKIDIETAERYLFEKNYEEWLPKAKVLVVELHDWMVPGCGQTFFAAVNKCIKNYRYTFYGGSTIIFNDDI